MLLGTTGTGVFDPLDAIADVCVKYGLWLHVDGSLGGSILFSDQHSAAYLKGIHR